MQLGARWQAGEPPHRSVPPELHDAIREQESLHPDAAAWTLTWLEGRPRCALGTDALLTLDQSGQVLLERDADSDDEDDWLLH